MHPILPRQIMAEADRPLSKIPTEDLLSCPLPDVYTRLQTSDAGLSHVEARRRLKTVGPNEPASTPHVAAAIQFLRLFLIPWSSFCFSPAWSPPSWAMWPVPASL